jgi:hypothetical protein
MRAAEAEPEAQPDELVRLLATAIEGMRDAARHLIRRSFLST